MFNYVTTKNSKEDIEYMLRWLTDVLEKANIPKTKLNQQVEAEIRDCIRDSYEGLPKNNLK